MAITRWKCIIPFFIVIIALNMCCLKIYGFEVSTTNNGNEIKWKKDTVTYLVNPTGGPSGSLDAILAAMQTWTEVDTSTFTFVDGGTTSTNNYGVADGVNIVDFGVIRDEGVLGQNSFWFYSSSGEMIDSDIRFNTKINWSTNGSPDKFDVQNVGTHELGHSLSLADLYNYSDSEKTMYGYGFAGDTSQRTLHQDDKDGITYLYPLNTASPTPTPAPGVVNGAVSGFVTDSDTGVAIQGAAVVHAAAAVFNATTDAAGFYKIENVPAGTHNFRASSAGYTSAIQSVVVTAGEVAMLYFALSEAAAPTIGTTPTPTLTPVCPDASQVAATHAYVDSDTLHLAKGSSEDVTVTVTDDAGCPAKGVKVTRKLSSASKKMINVRPPSATTDENGQAIFNIRAKKGKGEANVRFKVNGVKDTPKVKIVLAK